ncbi:hypothetical protein [Ornithinimicrobium kibberense]|uniref:hypothetical protein n=1 Tax=Ornithinimicrobium kibberense TaxID=282060 RepID=UPI00361F32F5
MRKASASPTATSRARPGSSPATSVIARAVTAAKTAAHSSPTVRKGASVRARRISSRARTAMKRNLARASGLAPAPRPGRWRAVTGGTDAPPGVVAGVICPRYAPRVASGPLRTWCVVQPAGARGSSRTIASTWSSHRSSTGKTDRTSQVAPASTYSCAGTPAAGCTTTSHPGRASAPSKAR